MRVILILFLILFVIVSSLFITTFISKMTGSPDEVELAAEAPVEDASISIISDIKPDTAPDIESLEEQAKEEAGFQASGSDEDDFQDNIEAEEVQQEEQVIEDFGTGEETETQEAERDPEQDTVKIYLDGDMENGIYLGAASYGLESSRARELYGEDLANSGFKFQWQNTDLDLEPGSTHFIYIYYYNTESGWDYLRKEISITGQKQGNPDIKIFIDEPTDQRAVDSLEIIRGWALDSTSSGNTGIGKVSIYLNGPKGFGLELGEADYGIPRSGVVDFFNNQDFLYSGYTIGLQDTILEQGSKHTLFVYAESLSGESNYNFEKTDLYISGERQETAVIKADIDIQALISQNTLSIEGYAIDKKVVEEYLAKQQEKSTGEDSSTSTANSGSSDYSATSQEYFLKKIVFMSDQDGNFNIFSMNLDGSDRKRLTDHNGSDLYPEVSPDGMKIAYTAEINGIWQIIVMDWDGSNKKQITNNSYRSAYPTWSHDMRYIYFEASLDGDWELFRIKTDGSSQKRLTYNSGGHDWHPSAHPFDNKIIFESGMPGHDNIYIMNHDGSSISRMFSNNDRRRVPDISHDSTMLTYTKYFGNNCEVHYTNIKEMNEIRISYNGDNDGHPCFSPDDKLIAYEERSGGQENIIIYTIATGQKINITNSSYIDRDPSFMFQK